MIRRTFMVGALLVIVGAGLAWAMNARYSSGTAGLSITDVNRNTPFVNNHSGGDSVAFSAMSVSICSRSTSANSCFVDLGDGVATTADWRLAPGACIQATYVSENTGGAGWAALGSICAAGETATFDIMAGR